MNKRYEALKDNEIQYVRTWTEKFNVGQTFTFEGWKKQYADDDDAPAATKIGAQVVEALEQTPPDTRLDFIGLSEGPQKGGKTAEKSGANHQYYVRQK